MQNHELAESRKHSWVTTKDTIVTALSQEVTTEEEKNALAHAINIHSLPIDPEDLKACCAYLVAQYTYDNEPVDKIAATKISYLYELKDHSGFAVFAAILWWNSRHNPQAKWLPKAGEISARCVIEAKILERARGRVRAFDKLQQHLAYVKNNQPKEVSEMTLAEFDKWCSSIGVNTDPMQRGYYNKRHLFFGIDAVLKTMRDRIVAREEQKATQISVEEEEAAVLANIDKFQGDTPLR